MFAALLPLIAVSILSATLSSASPLVQDTASLEARQVQDTRIYRITNKCPQQIKLYSAGAYWRDMAIGETVVQTTNGPAGPYYTDANGGEAGGARATKAAFWDRNFYYIVKDPNHLNVAISVSPDRFARQGLCMGIECKTSVCDNGFPLPGPATLPSPDAIHTEAPMFSCPTAPGDTLTYNIVFCPSGSFPAQTQGAEIHPSYNPGKCLDVEGGRFANGTPVQVYDCNGTAAQRWVFVRGSTKVRVANTNFCLDAGSNPANGINLKIWQCYDNLRAQQWNYERWGNRIRLDAQVNGRSYCADLRDGILTNWNKIQNWECADQNTNQIWTIPFA